MYGTNLFCLPVHNKSMMELGIQDRQNLGEPFQANSVEREAEITEMVNMQHTKTFDTPKL